MGNVYLSLSLGLALAVVGCASQEAIPEVSQERGGGRDCGLSALADSPPTDRALGSCGRALERLDDGDDNKKRR
jgi:hypothetical protein